MPLPADDSRDLFTLFRRVREWADATYPGHQGVTITVQLPTGKITRLQIPTYTHRDSVGETAARALTPAVRWRHTADYREVHWWGHVFRLSKTRAAVVELLDLARQEGTAEIRQSEILQKIGSDATRLSDLFRGGDGQKAWGTLIIQGEEPGTYKLADRPAEGDQAAS